MPGISSEAFNPETEEAVDEVKQKLDDVLDSALAIRYAISEHLSIIGEIGGNSRVVEAPAGRIFKLESLEDGVFVQVYSMSKEKSFQSLPAQAEFYAADIVFSAATNTDRLAVMIARRPDREGDERYHNPLIITSKLFKLSTIAGSEYEPRLNYAGRFGPEAPRWEKYPRGKVI